MALGDMQPEPGCSGAGPAGATFFSYTSRHTMPAKKRCCMISLASSGPPPSLRRTRGRGVGAAGPPGTQAAGRRRTRSLGAAGAAQRAGTVP